MSIKPSLQRRNLLTGSELDSEEHSGADRATDSSPPTFGGLTGRQHGWILLTTLVVIDVLLLIANILHFGANDPDEPVTRFSSPAWNGDADGSFIELTGHLQLIAGVVMLVFLAVIRRTAVYVAWAVTLIVLIVDDFAQVHEVQGGLLALRFGLPSVAGLRPEDVGELTVWAIEGVFCLTLILATLWWADLLARRHSRLLFLCVIVLAFFGGVVDQLHIVVEPYLSHTAGLAVTLTETTGELGAMTLIVLAVHRMTRAQDRRVRLPSHD